MIVTEEEAKTKRCQESYGDTHVTTGGHMISSSMSMGGGVFAIQTSPSMCIGSACMAWRWRGWSNGNGVYSENNPTAAHPDFKRFGYCGKAGAP